MSTSAVQDRETELVHMENKITKVTYCGLTPTPGVNYWWVHGWPITCPGCIRELGRASVAISEVISAAADTDHLTKVLENE